MPRPSSRLDRIPPYLFAEMSRIKAEAIAAGKDVIDLGIGDPDQPTPQPIVEALARAAADPATHRYDESPRGWPPFLCAATEWYQREFGVTMDPDREACQLIGSKEGLGHLAWAYLDPGDVAIVPDPGYTVYSVNASMAGADVHATPLLAEHGYLPHLDDIPTDVARRAKLFYVCYPHNPTGAVASPEFYADLVRFCREFDIAVVADLAYAAVAFDGFCNPTAMQAPDARERTIEFHSLSKTFNMTGWRLGFALGAPELVGVLQRFKSNLDSKQFPAIAEAGAFALRNVDHRPAIALLQCRRDALCDGLARTGWSVPRPQASFYVWAPVPAPNMTSAEFATALLERSGVLVIPGTGYGACGEGFVRMSLTLTGDRNGERFAQAVERIAASGLVPQPAGA